MAAQPGREVGVPSLTADGRRLNGRGSKWITPVRRLAIYLRDGFTCAYCGRDLRGAAPREITLDHLTCKALGGGHESTNLVTACLTCNSSRGALVAWWRYATGGAVARIKVLRRKAPNVALAKALLAGAVAREVAVAEARRALTLTGG